jgi:hypothetical protein
MSGELRYATERQVPHSLKQKEAGHGKATGWRLHLGHLGHPKRAGYEIMRNRMLRAHQKSIFVYNLQTDISDLVLVGLLGPLEDLGRDR